MKKVLFTILLAGLTVGVARTGYAQGYSNCVNNNSRACVDARNAFAGHHGGAMPEQYYNNWYGGNQGRWSQQNNEWRWEGMNGDQYQNGRNGWEWKHQHDHDRDHDHR